MSGHNKEEEDYGSKVASDDGSNASEDLVVMRQQGTHAASMRVVGRRGSYLRIQKGIPAASSYSNLKRNQSESKTVSINLGQSMVRVRAPEQIPDRVLQDFDVCCFIEILKRASANFEKLLFSFLEAK